MKQPEQPRQLLNSSQKYKVKPLPNATAVNIPRLSSIYCILYTVTVERSVCVIFDFCPQNSVEEHVHKWIRTTDFLSSLF